MTQAKLFEYGAGARIAFYVGFFFLFMLVVSIGMINSRPSREERQQAAERFMTPSMREAMDRARAREAQAVETERVRREAKIQAALDAIQHREPPPGALSQ